MKSSSILRVENLEIQFSTPGRQFLAIRGVSFDVPKGKTLGLVGESGCGKSVTSLAIMRLLATPPGKVTGGKIFFEDRDLLSLSEKQMRDIRGNSLAMIFQEPMTSLNPVFTVGDQIAETFREHKGMNKKDSLQAALEMMQLVKIPAPEKRLYEFPHQLSGGMRQRIMIAMALACKPKVLIADEPTTALDVTIQAQILALMNQLQQQVGMSIVLITHDLGVVAETCDEVAVMYAGKIVEKASIKELFSNPKHPYTLGLMESIPKISERSATLKTIPGMVPNLWQLPRGCKFQDRCPRATDQCRMTEPELVTLSRTTAHEVACHHV